MKNWLLLSLIILIVSCNSSNKNKTPNYVRDIKNEIRSLSNEQEHQLFLDKLYHNSEGKEQKINQLRQNFFKNRVEISKLQKEIDSLRIINSIKVNYYIDEYGYPSSAEIYTKNQFLAIYYSLLYCNSSKIQLEHYQTIKKLYQDNKLNKHYFLTYLSRTYYNKKNMFYSFKNKKNIKTMIDEIIPEIENLRKELDY